MGEVVMVKSQRTDNISLISTTAYWCHKFLLSLSFPSSESKMYESAYIFEIMENQ